MTTVLWAFESINRTYFSNCWDNKPIAIDISCPVCNRHVDVKGVVLSTRTFIIQWQISAVAGFISPPLIPKTSIKKKRQSIGRVSVCWWHSLIIDYQLIICLTDYVRVAVCLLPFSLIHVFFKIEYSIRRVSLLGGQWFCSMAKYLHRMRSPFAVQVNMMFQIILLNIRVASLHW